MLRKLRIAVLLLILVIVAMKTWQEQHLSKLWRVPLYVSIYPIPADDSPVTVPPISSGPLTETASCPFTS